MASLFRVFKPAASTLCAAAFALATLLSAPLASPAAAQGLGWFGNLFGGGLPRQTQSAPTYPGYNNGSGYAPRTHAETYYNRPRHRLPRRKPVEQVQREAPKERPPTPPKNASIFVYVFGDSLGQMLADGLDDSFVDRQDVAVVHKARGSTGLVTAEYYDWPKSIAELLAGHDIADAKGEKPAADKAKGDVTEAKGDAGAGKDAKAVAKADAKPARVKIDVAVMMIGSNDRQPLQVDGKTVQPGTPSWTAAYSKRVMAIDEAFRAKNVPLVWVGVPITKDDGYADAMAALNDIYREAAGKTGAIYVDTWEAFSDDNGNFSSYGPDVNGQTVRLRAADGIQFTKAGARKLAHFVETHVRRALDGKTPAPELPTAELPNDPAQDGSAKDGSATDGRPKDEKAKPVVAARPDVGPIRNLNEPPTATSGTLATLDAKTSARETYSAILHGTGPAPAGRADDSRWPGDTRANP